MGKTPEWVLLLTDRERRIYDNGRADGIREGMELAEKIALSDLDERPDAVAAGYRFDSGASEATAKRIAEAIRAAAEREGADRG